MNRFIQTTLDFRDMTCREVADEKQIDADFAEIFTAFIKVVEEAYIETRKEYALIPLNERGRNLFACIMNGKVCGRMINMFPDKIRRVKHGRIGCIINGTIAHFKKLNAKFKPNHALSINSQLLFKNLQPTGKKYRSVIWMGYTMSKNNAILTGIYVSHFMDGVRKWVKNLHEWVINKKIKDLVSPIEEVHPHLKITKKKTGEN